ncbi:MAG: tRNA (N6-isopentenyl adenosine(37)-C2)-methylthiotransferase MiaB [Elusimicrobiota bacterium]|nr:tRNA (N6-isopentenyl adenosine(37)-C2)-methylthiotransferase MiaB [Elusimicrobiota bacterium]
MKKVYIQTFGCQMNIADSDEMMLQLAARGCSPCDSLKEADIVVVNTCTIRDHAEHKALSYLGRLAKWKAEKKGRIVIFAGCAAQRLGKALRRKFPQADIIAGAKNIDSFSDILETSGLFKNKNVAAGIPSAQLVGLVNIMRGCSCKCSYCIVPYVRGEAASISPEVILKETERKVAQGAKEIMLLGQTVNAYNYKGKNFAKLLKDITNLPGLERVRFMSPHPIFIDEEFAQVAASSDKISKHMHLPVQSGSTKVLKDMKRLYSRSEFLQKAALLKAAGICLSTDIIVGYPTETEEDFKDTLSLFDEVEFNGAYCFKFSPRQGTPAAALPLIPEEIVEKRLDILLNKVRLSSKAAYEAQLGTVQKVLMETPTNGRTLTNFWVRTKTKYNPGDVVDLKIKETKETILLA